MTGNQCEDCLDKPRIAERTQIRCSDSSMPCVIMHSFSEMNTICKIHQFNFRNIHQKLTDHVNSIKNRTKLCQCEWMELF